MTLNWQARGQVPVQSPSPCQIKKGKVTFSYGLWDAITTQPTTLEEFDKAPVVEEKGKISVNFQDKSLNPSRNSGGICWSYGLLWLAGEVRWPMTIYNYYLLILVFWSFDLTILQSFVPKIFNFIKTKSSPFLDLKVSQLSLNSLSAVTSFPSNCRSLKYCILFVRGKFSLCKQLPLWQIHGVFCFLNCHNF